MADSKNVIYTDMGLEQIMRGIKTLDKVRLHVGVVGAGASAKSAESNVTVAEAAAINYYGSTKMGIPPRRFLDVPHSAVAKEFAEVAKAVVNFEDPDDALDQAGAKMAEFIRDRILNKEFAPNQLSTVAKKGFDHPLMDTSALFGAIGHEVVRGDDSVGEGGSAGDYASFEITGGE